MRPAAREYNGASESGPNMRILTAAAALLVSLSAYAVGVCPSVQWTQLDTSTGGYVVDSIESIDFDEDGKLDLVGVIDGSQTDALAWWKGAGDGTFGNATELESAMFMSNVAVAELTGDAYLDVAVVTSANFDLRIYPGTGSGRGAVVTSYVGNIPNTITAVNMDADAVSELVVSYGPGAWSVHDRVGGSFTTTNYGVTPEDTYAHGIVSADFDLDGRFDLAISLRELPDSGYGDLDGVYVYFGNANGTFSAPVVLTTPGAYGLTAADIDVDGKMDLIATSWINNLSWDPSTISLFRNTGSRTFAASTLTVSRPGNVGNAPFEVEVAEVTNDTNPDLLVSVVNGNWITTFAGLGSATYRQPTFTSLDHLSSIAVADFTGDGQLEIGVGNLGGITVLARSCATQVHLYTEAPMITAGTDAILHASVSGFRTGMSAPLGTISLYEGPTELATGQLGTSGTITFTLTGQTFSVGDHTLYAVFSGNSEVSSAQSANVTQRVTSSVTSVTIPTPIMPTHGKPISFALSINGASPYADFVDVRVDGGTSFKHYTYAPLSLTLATGQHTIEARFPGASYYPRSPWASLTFTVMKDIPTMTIGGSLAARQGTAHALTVTVSTTGTLAAPTGNVHMYEDTNTFLATAALVNGVASFSRTFTRGSHALRFAYDGDANFLLGGTLTRVEVLPNVAFALDARSLTNGIQIYALPMQDTSTQSLQLQRRVAGTSSWTNVAGFTGITSGVDTTVARGVAYEYQMIGSLTGGTPIVSNTDAAMFFTDDPLAPFAVIKRTHFTELATAVNLLRSQASLAPFAYESNFTTPGLIRASHLTSLRTALTEARTALGMTTPALSGVSTGAAVQLLHILDTRDLAR